MRRSFARLFLILISVTAACFGWSPSLSTARAAADTCTITANITGQNIHVVLTNITKPGTYYVSLDWTDPNTDPGDSPSATSAHQSSSGSGDLAFDFKVKGDPTKYVVTANRDGAANPCTNSTQNSAGNAGNDTTTGNLPPATPPQTYPTLANNDTLPQTACQKDNTSTDCKKELCNKDKGMIWVVAFGNQCETFTGFFNDLIGYITMFASIIAGFVFLVGAYNYLASRGDPSKLTEGREMITNAIIGLILIGTAFAIIKFLNGAFQTVDSGINLLGPFGH